MGLTDFVISQLDVFLKDYQRNAFGVGAPTDAVLEVGGAPPEDFDQTLRRCIRASPLSNRGLGARLRAVWNVVRALVTPSPDLDAIASHLALPPVAHATLAADSTFWRASHEAKRLQFRSASR